VDERPGVEVGGSREILTGVARVLVEGGHPPARVAKEMQEICSVLSAAKTSFNRLNVEYVAKLPDVVAEWREDPLYIWKGRPRQLPMRGPVPSMTSLINSVLPNHEPRSIVQSLIRMGAIRRRGRFYECISGNVVFTGDEARWRALLVLHAVTRTISQNLSGKSLALEQSVISARVARRDIFPVRESIRRRGLPLLHGVDADLRRRARYARPGEPRTWAGVGLYEIDFPVEASPPRRRSVGFNSAGVQRKKRNSSLKVTR
jgi:hypothetical protein